MKIQLLTIGKQQDATTRDAMEDFTQRINRYFPCNWKLLQPSKATDPAMIKKTESQAVLQNIQKDDYMVLLDERGKNISSPDLAKLIQSRANESRKQIVFLIGGAYGVDASVQQ